MNEFLVVATVIILFALLLGVKELALATAAVIPAVLGFRQGYEAWNTPLDCTGFCGFLSPFQGMAIMIISVMVGIVGLNILRKSFGENVVFFCQLRALRKRQAQEKKNDETKL
ncbi:MULTISPECIES: hypothetical protein [Enterobacter cloacae complex]|uniref:hypothetical protein n=1 Tax=Enterobacter cloacae complex TaxID=354276 RepID=UPI0022F0F5CC|nr:MULTISPECIES: hypothetical protein [Enterobacter cloacae complex]EBC8304219.1 hypothetical protein [Salmonella enterica]HDS6669472.1 hypothetical protein [Enterobacter ludwigii]EHJ1703255.1 hypothetical protein [Salmonella enterica]MDA4736877.1 hypothetical protein [Enterobacter kobei]MDA4743147.1 hypothetical protein [Enterobacter hormaechei]